MHSNIALVANIPFSVVTWWRFGLEVASPGDREDVISMVVLHVPAMSVAFGRTRSEMDLIMTACPSPRK